MGSMRWTAVLALAGCQGVFGIREVGTGGDGQPGRVCDHGAPFGNEQAVDVGGTTPVYSVEGARFDPAQTNAYLSLCPLSGDKSMCDLYTSQLNPATKAFGLINKLTSVSDGSHYDAYPTITPDFQYLVFGSDRMDNLPKLYVAKAIGGGFDMSTASVLVIPPGATFGNEPYILPDGGTLYFEGGTDPGNPELYRASGAPPTFGGSATLLASVNGPTGDFAPVVTDDELEMFFASDRKTGASIALDIYTSTRTSTSVPFGAPQLVTNLSNDADVDWPLWISPDRCSLYLIHKPMATGVGTLYLVSR